MKRPSLKAVMELGVFDRFIELSKAKGPGTVVQVKDRDGKPVQRRGKVQSVW